MSKRDSPFGILADFVPEGTYEMVLPFFRQYDIHLTITHDRATILGNYRPPTAAYPAHRISINGSLNPYSFLITLLHELAHMVAYIKYRRSIMPHGREWKNIFAAILADYMGKGIFPDNVEAALMRYQGNITASTCSDPELYKALKTHDRRRKNMRLVEEIPLNELFATHDGRVFQKIEKLRTRFRCREVSTGYVYLFPAIAEVRMIGAAI
ncbi:MAG: SprT-like domain-containing protein [Edaphocola sp.]